MFWISVEYVVAVLLVYALVTQVVIPLMEDRPMLPVLSSRREGRIIDELRQTHQSIHEVDLEAQVKALKEQLHKRQEDINKEDVGGLPADDRVQGDK